MNRSQSQIPSLIRCQVQMLDRCQNPSLNQSLAQIPNPSPLPILHQSQIPSLIRCQVQMLDRCQNPRRYPIQRSQSQVPNLSLILYPSQTQIPIRYPIQRQILIPIRSQPLIRYPR